MNMELTNEQKLEKAIQHVIFFAQFANSEYLGTGENVSDLLCAAAARAYKAHYQPSKDLPIEWVANSFAKYMQELII